MNKQYELARIITGSKSNDVIIQKEVSTHALIDMMEGVHMLDELLKQHNQPFDKGWNQMKIDFEKIAFMYGIDVASMFVIYMNYLSKRNGQEG